MYEFEFEVIQGKVVHDIISQESDRFFNVIKNTYLEHGNGNTVNPNSYFLRFPEKSNARIIALPAALCANHKIAGIKWIASNPDNITKGIPRASAVIILNDYETGYPFACIEAAIISSSRTAYSAVLAAEHLSPFNKKSKSLLIVGNGIIAEKILRTFLSRNWEFEVVKLYDKNIECAQKFKEHFDNSPYKIEVCPSLNEALSRSDLIVFTTTVSKPYVDDRQLFAHSPIILNISLRDIAPEVMFHAYNIVDDIEHVLSANTSPHLTLLQYSSKKFITGSIDKLLLNELEFSHDKPIIFSPMGMGVLDIAMAYEIYQIATQKKLGIKIDNFFYEISR